MSHKSKGINISADSMIQLKAELIKKQEEFKKLKHENLFRPKKLKEKVDKKSDLEKKNVGVEKRFQKDLEAKLEEFDALQKSKNILENKAKLYERMSQKMLTDDEYNKLPFLVDFEQKIIDKSVEKQRKKNLLDEKLRTARNKLKSNNNTADGKLQTCKNKTINSDDDDDDDDVVNDEDENFYKSEDPEEQWVEFVDSLGRTRKCLKKYFQHYKQLDQKLNHNNNNNNNNNSEGEGGQNKMTTGEPELMSNDMKREMERRKWEEEVMKMKMKDEIHYSDVTFNEIRDHGVGFYNFARDEETRRQQMQVLDELRQQTKIQRKMFSSLKERRKRALDIRLAKVMQRSIVQKAIQLSGLDPLTFIDKSSTFMMDNTDDDDVDDDSLIGPKLPDNNDDGNHGDDGGIEQWKRDDTWRKDAPIREWDVGKKVEIYDDDGWMIKRRKERVKEFAPPTNYYNQSNRSTNYNNQSNHPKYDHKILDDVTKDNRNIKLSSEEFFKSKSHFYGGEVVGDCNVKQSTNNHNNNNNNNNGDGDADNDDQMNDNDEDEDVSLGDMISANLKMLRKGDVVVDVASEVHPPQSNNNNNISDNNYNNSNINNINNNNNNSNNNNINTTTTTTTTTTNNNNNFNPNLFNNNNPFTFSGSNYYKYMFNMLAFNNNNNNNYGNSNNNNNINNNYFNNNTNNENNNNNNNTNTMNYNYMSPFIPSFIPLFPPPPACFPPSHVELEQHCGSYDATTNNNITTTYNDNTTTLPYNNTTTSTCNTNTTMYTNNSTQSEVENTANYNANNCHNDINQIKVANNEREPVSSDINLKENDACNVDYTSPSTQQQLPSTTQQQFLARTTTAATNEHTTCSTLQQKLGPQPAHFSCGPMKPQSQHRPIKYEPIHLHEIPLTLPPPLSQSSSKVNCPLQGHFIGSLSENNNNNNYSDQKDVREWHKQFHGTKNVDGSANNNDDDVKSTSSSSSSPWTFPSSSSSSISELKPSTLPFASPHIQSQQFGKSASDKAAEEFNPLLPPPTLNK